MVTNLTTPIEEWARRGVLGSAIIALPVRERFHQRAVWKEALVAGMVRRPEARPRMRHARGSENAAAGEPEEVASGWDTSGSDTR
jgi:hypothetical protein